MRFYVLAALLVAVPAWAGLRVAYDADDKTLKTNVFIGDPPASSCRSADCTGASLQRDLAQARPGDHRGSQAGAGQELRRSRRRSQYSHLMFRVDAALLLRVQGGGIVPWAGSASSSGGWDWTYGRESRGRKVRLVWLDLRVRGSSYPQVMLDRIRQDRKGHRPPGRQGETDPKDRKGHRVLRAAYSALTRAVKDGPLVSVDTRTTGTPTRSSSRGPLTHSPLTGLILFRDNFSEKDAEAGLLPTGTPVVVARPDGNASAALRCRGWLGSR
jgi:hypothetical protein